jgi:gliding motility-associated-like protein
MKKILLFIFLSISFLGAFSQRALHNGACLNGDCVTMKKTPAPLDGSGVWGQTYTFNKCGLNYIAVSQKIGQRFSPPGPPQPVTLSVTGLPGCQTIEKAFLYADASGTGVAINASITNPNSVTNSFPLTQIGSGQDKCWGYSGTYSYRGDVTSIISGNGNYIISGLPVGNPDDVDGITLFIIYADPTANYRGDIVIWDGCIVGVGNNNAFSITGLSPCANSTAASTFMIVADLQGIGSTMVTNGSAPFSLVDDWWNYMDNTTTVLSSQTTSQFGVNSSGDCYNMMMGGLYWQTTSCTTCPLAGNNLTLNTSGVNATCGVCNGSATANVNGGLPPYTYTWTPGGQTTQTATGLCGGTYIVTVNDSTGCNLTADTIVLAGSAPNASFTSGPPSGCAPHCVTFNDGTSPGCVTVNWNFGDNQTGTGSSPTHCYTAPGVYTVTMICLDASGCPDTVVTTNMITVYPVPSAGFTVAPSTTIISAPSTPVSVCFTNSTSNGITYFWDFGDGGNDTSTAASPCYTYSDTGTYCINMIAVGANGCADTITACIIILPGVSLIIPNVFTPNGDGHNNIFYFPSQGLKSLRCVIYNRWGSLVAEWDGVTGGWDGKLKNGKEASDGTYYFTVYAEGLDGGLIDEAGWVQLIRGGH